MGFSVGDRVRLKVAKEIGGVQHAAGARGVVDYTASRTTLHVRMDDTGAAGTVRAIDLINDRHAVTSRTADWVVITSRVGSGALRGAGGAELPDIPDFIAEDRFEVVERVEARESPRAAGLRAAAPAPLQLEVLGQSDQAYVAVARHPSGALTFHVPEAGNVVVRGAGAARGRSTQLVFSILVGSPAPSEAAPGFASRGIVGRIVKVVVIKVVDFAAGEAVEFLGKKLEEKLWRDAGRREGWVRVVPQASGESSLQPGRPTLPAAGRGLLCIHGTFSNTLSAFKDLLRGQTLHDLRGRYADHIYGFEHFTISKSPGENVREMLRELPAGAAMTFDVITHSRGGLVLRTLLAELARHGGTPPMRIGRVILVAAPNRGTPLATPQRWEDTLGWFANLIELFPDNPFTTGAGWVSGALSWLAQKVTGQLPGLSSMDIDGEVVSTLQTAGVPTGAEWYALVANYEPDDAKLLVRLADMGVDGFFAGANDLVVPTEGGWQFGDNPAVGVPADRVGCFGAGGNLVADQPGLVNHVSFFRRPETHTFILNALTGMPLGLAPVVTARRLPMRAAMRAADSVGVTAPAGVIDINVRVPPQEAVTASTAAVARLAHEDDPWNRQDSLHLIVLPAPNDSPSSGRRPDAQLLASYSGASVLAPFRLSGKEDGAGGRWQRIIDGHRDINEFVEGTRETELTLQNIEDYGGVLFETLFREDVRRLYDQARFRHVRRKLNVVFTSMIPWVADLPWEFAFDQSCRAFLATSDVRFVRNVLTPVPADKIPVREGEPLRILVVSAQPRSVAALSLAQERALIESAFRPLIDRNAVRVDVLAEATPDDLHARVRQGAEGEFDVVHFMGHGRFDDETETGYLIFEDGKRNVQELSTSHVKDILRSRGIKLVFLNACQTGRGARADYNKGVAPGLVADGVPAVVANQYSVLDRSATTFARHFYWCLAQGLALGDAAREARIALNYSGGGLIGWAVPVLFARNPDAVLCRALVREDGSSFATNPVGAGGGSFGPAPLRDDGTSPSAPSPNLAFGATSTGVPPQVSPQASTDRAAATITTRAAPHIPVPQTAGSQFSLAAATPQTSVPTAPQGVSPVVFSDDETLSSKRVISVAVWDVNAAIPELEEVVAAMNAAQSAIEFRVASLTAPYGLWKVDANKFGKTAYLPAERTAKRLKKLIPSTRADYLLCVTDLPLADEVTTNLYLWFGGDGESPEWKDNRVIIFSTWGFSPPLQGELLQRALVNVAVQALAGLLAKEAPIETTRGTIGYFNPQREVAQLAGRLRIGPRNRSLLLTALEKQGLPAKNLVDALEALLERFRPPSDGADDDIDVSESGSAPQADKAAAADVPNRARHKVTKKTKGTKRGRPS